MGEDGKHISAVIFDLDGTLVDTRKLSLLCVYMYVCIYVN